MCKFRDAQKGEKGTPLGGITHPATIQAGLSTGHQTTIVVTGPSAGLTAAVTATVGSIYGIGTEGNGTMTATVGDSTLNTDHDLPDYMNFTVQP